MQPDAPSDPPVHVRQTAVGPATWTDEGEGPVVVAIHGLPGSVRHFRWLGAALEPHLRFIRIEQPGFGACPAWGPPTRNTYVEHVIRVLDALKLDRVTLLGHSFGAGVAMSVAAEAPGRVSRLALLAPLGLRPHKALRRFPRVPLGLALSTPGARQALTPRLMRSMKTLGFRSSEAEAIRSMQSIGRWRFAQSVQAAKAVQCPVLGAWADDDWLVEPAIVTELLAALPPGPHLNFETGGHDIQKTQALPIAHALLEWLAEENDAVMSEPARPT